MTPFIEHLLNSPVPVPIQRLEQGFQTPPLQPVEHPLLIQRDVQLWIKRTDLLHPVISGNKWYKLKYNLVAALRQGAKGIVSFGGAWSNHLHALAAACCELQLPVTAVIRGEPELIDKSQMLQDAAQWGMQFHFVTRAEYRQRENEDWLQQLMQSYPGYLLVPEGGSSALAELGLVELGQELEQQLQAEPVAIDQLWCAMGTGGTFAGLLAARTQNYQMLGMPVLKGGDFLRQEVEQKLAQSVYLSGSAQTSSSGSAGSDSRVLDHRDFTLITDGHLGGYGKVSPELVRWINQFYQDTGVPLDPIYTGKLLYRFFQGLELPEGEIGAVAAGSRVVLLHSGGLQGRRGFGLPWLAG